MTRLLVTTLLLASFAHAARAHPLDPGLLELREEGTSGRFAVRLLAPRAAPAARALVPAGCVAAEPGDAISCGKARLAGASIGVAGLDGSAARVLARVRFGDGRVRSAWLDAGTPRFAVPAAPAPAALFANHARLGAAHLVGGLDHLLFLAGLVALLRRGRPLVLAVTAFTAGHAVTLACAVLGVLRVPAAAIEPAIAATLVWLAFELARRAEGEALAAHRPLALPFAFGLLHGAGFARALDWLGVAHGELPLALAGFNLGIEVAQLAVVLLLVGAAALLAPLAQRGLAPRVASLAPAYALGTLGVYWLLERVAAAATGL